MNSELFLNIITCIAGIMSGYSFYSVVQKSIKKYVNMKEEKIEKYKLELKKQLLELEKMEKEIGIEEVNSVDKEKYETAKILISNLIEQYKKIEKN